MNYRPPFCGGLRRSILIQGAASMASLAMKAGGAEASARKVDTRFMAAERPEAWSAFGALLEPSMPWNPARLESSAKANWTGRPTGDKCCMLLLTSATQGR